MAKRKKRPTLEKIDGGRSPVFEIGHEPFQESHAD
jgi:hypothetical protein